MRYRKLLEKQAKSDTGMAVMLKVFMNHMPVGVGYVVYYAGEDNGQPTLCDFDGKPLPEAWFFLQAYEQILCVVPRNVQ